MISFVSSSPISIDSNSRRTSEPIEAKKLLPAPTESDVGTQIAMLLLQAQHARRTDLREEMRAEAKNEQSQQEQQLHDMEAKANYALGAGLFSAAGAASGAATSLWSEKTGKAIAAFADGGAKVGSATFGRISEGFNVDATAHGQNASRIGEHKQSLRGELDDAKSITNKALQFMSEFQKQQAETTLSIWRR